MSGKVAVITGAARGQGRAIAVTLAERGADVIAVDICRQIPSAHYEMPTEQDLDETLRLVEEAGGKAVKVVADVRDRAGLTAGIADGISILGAPDTVIAQAGIASVAPRETDHPDAWRDHLDIHLTGVLNTLKATVPAMVEADKGGSIAITSSAWALRPPATDVRGVLGYQAAKHGQIALMRSYAGLLAPKSIRVNTVHPTSVSTPSVVNIETGELLPPLQKFYEECPPQETRMNRLPIQFIEAQDVANAIAWLVSDDSRYVTGIMLPVDAGLSLD